MALVLLPLLSPSRDWIDVLSLTVSIILMVAGAVGVIIALRTLNAVKRQADEMLNQVAQMKVQTQVAKDAADAALLNARSVINSERPWLLIKPSVTWPDASVSRLSFAIESTNVGRSPAEIIYAAIKWKTLLSPDELGSDPFFSESTPVSTHWAHTRWVAPNEHFVPDMLEGRLGIFSYDAAELWKYLMEGTRVIVVMGYIRYRDAISSGVHESRYCYSISLNLGTAVMTGPPGYNKLT